MKKLLAVAVMAAMLCLTGLAMTGLQPHKFVAAYESVRGFLES